MIELDVLPIPTQAEVEAAAKWCKQQSSWPLHITLKVWLKRKANSGNGYRWLESNETYSAWYDAVAAATSAMKEAWPTDESLEVCPSCGNPNLSDAQFCSNCGTNLNRDPNAILAALKSRVTALEENLSQTHNDINEWKWAKLDEGERWIVWWGIAWRGLLVYLGVLLVLWAVASASQ